MKNLLIFCFVLLGVIIPCSGESSSFQFSFQTDPEEDIELLGDLSNPGIRSVLPTPIQAMIGSNYLNAYFLYNVGDINVEVHNSSGELIYETSVDTSIQSSISIDVTEWNSGKYEIRFVNTIGSYMYGCFEI